MQIEIKIDETCTETTVTVRAPCMTEEVQRLVNRLSQDLPEALAGFREETARLLEQAEIIRVYASGGKVFASSADGEYSLRLRLYELEERLDRRCFVRISNSEIINLKMVKCFDLSFTGTICVSLEGGIVTYVSRRYVSKIKKTLGI